MSIILLVFLFILLLFYYIFIYELYLLDTIEEDTLRGFIGKKRIHKTHIFK